MIALRPITHLRRSSYRRRSLFPLFKAVSAVLILAGMFYGILILLGGFTR